MISKLTWHFQRLGTEVDAIAAASGARYVKVMDPPDRNPFPGKIVIGRTYIPDSESNALVAQGAAGAEQWFARCLPVYQSRSYVTWWEGPNEPQDIYDPAFRAALVAFSLRLTDLLHGIGKQCVALNLSVGAPDILDFMDFKTLAGKVDALGFHEYSAPTMQDRSGWLCLRYRKYQAAWATAGLPWPKTFITECGIDGGVINRPRTGWKSYATRAEYMAQLSWYDAELAKDPAVLAATIFGAGADWVWQDFDFDADLSRMLAAHIKTEVPPMANDPRAANCRAFHVNANGKVDGINLVWQPVPSAKYACVSAQLIDEEAAQGNTVVTVDVLNADGIKTAERALMVWPYGGPPADDSPAGPGNTNNQFTTTSVYTPPAIGPLGFIVGDANKAPISDFVWGYGLPGARHISGYVVFKERSGAVVPPPEPGGALPENEPIMPVGQLADKCRWWLEESIRQDEAGNRARAEAIRYSLIKLDGGLFYRLERALKAGQPQG